ncbi:MAG: endolytic transglycosylase MltG [Candidatus Cloacimonetes bacterium]|nr:endolytic transglycosylase MltG [Candidatus Cloacimonadota bacterium]
MRRGNGEPRKKGAGPIRLLLFLLLTGIVLPGGFALWLFEAPAGDTTIQQEVRIRPGTSLAQVVSALDTLGISDHPWALRLLARLTDSDRGIQPGIFVLDGRMSRMDILRRIGRYAVPGVDVRITEGLRLRELAGVVARQCQLDSLRFLQLCRDPGFISELSLPGDPETLEGRLFPDTYRISTLDDEEALITRMARRMEDVVCSLLPDSCGSLDRVRLLTLASIVQGEYQLPSEADTIASVYLNRLRRGMKLQADPTVQYLLDKPRRLLYRDLELDSPWNTYLYAGLPPGPINSPGRIAIAAVLFPAETDYLYFVADGQGGHFFGRTLAQHQLNRRVLDSQRRRLRQEQREGRRTGDSLSVESVDNDVIQP